MVKTFDNLNLSPALPSLARCSIGLGDFARDWAITHQGLRVGQAYAERLFGVRFGAARRRLRQLALSS